MRIFGARAAVATESPSRRGHPPTDPAPGAKDDPIHIRVRDLHKHYGPHHVLKGVSFDILRKRTNVVIGPSGSGKSVLMRQIIRLEKPDSGQVLVDGIDYAVLEGMALERKRRGMGMVFQMSALFDSMTVFDNVAYGLREQRLLPEAEIPQRVSESLTAVSLPGTEGRWPKELSGGMQKRVALARAVAMRPRMLIYDEPTEGLDPINVTRVNRLLLGLRDRFGITTMVVTHNMRSAFVTSDRLAFLHEGRIALSGSPDEFRRHDHDPILRHFVAASRLDLPTGESIPPPPLR